MNRRWLCLFLVLALAGVLFGNSGNRDWLKKVPAKDRERSNPYANSAEAAAAGAKIYAENCAQCHGAEAEGTLRGRHYRPNLHSDRIKEAKPGELFWILTNGSLRNGMPSWNRLPEAQRWQLVTYLKSLP